MQKLLIASTRHLAQTLRHNRCWKCCETTITTSQQTKRKMRFKYTVVDDNPTESAPRLSLVLHRGPHSVEVNGLVDSGSAVNLIPYPVGVALGAVWEEQPLLAPLVGSLGRMEVRGVTFLALHSQLAPEDPIRLVFAWTQAEDAPV